MKAGCIRGSEDAGLLSCPFNSISAYYTASYSTIKENIYLLHRIENSSVLCNLVKASGIACKNDGQQLSEHIRQNFYILRA